MPQQISRRPFLLGGRRCDTGSGRGPSAGPFDPAAHCRGATEERTEGVRRGMSAKCRLRGKARCVEHEAAGRQETRPPSMRRRGRTAQETEDLLPPSVALPLHRIDPGAEPFVDVNALGGGCGRPLRRPGGLWRRELGIARFSGVIVRRERRCNVGRLCGRQAGRFTGPGRRLGPQLVHLTFERSQFVI